MIRIDSSSASHYHLDLTEDLSRPSATSATSMTNALAVDGIEPARAAQFGVMDDVVLFAGSSSSSSEINDETRSHLQATSDQAPGFEELADDTANDVVDAKLAELEAMLGERGNNYGVMAAFMGFVGRPELVRAYGDLFSAMGGDLQQIDGWRGKSREDKIALFNRISLEASVEVRHNIAISDGSKAWSREEVAQLDETLLSLPRRFVLENPNLSIFQRDNRLTDSVSGRPIGGDASDSLGRIRITDLVDRKGNVLPGISPGTIAHEVGHLLDDESPRWDEWKAISGWRDVDQTLAETTLGELSDGDRLFGWELGFEDARDESFILQRNGSQTFAFKASEATNFARPYGRSTPFEDFATAFELYYERPDELRNLSPRKYDFMRSFFDA